MVIGLTGSAALMTFTNPAPNAPAPHAMLYVVGEFVVALYVSGVVWVIALKHTLAAAADAVMVGNGFMVIVPPRDGLTQREPVVVTI